MMKVDLGLRTVAIAALLLCASLARAGTVTYTASFNTSKGNPVYDILILETDAAQQVHATIYPSPLPGTGIAAISHTVPFTPVKTLVIGLTEGKDTDGSDKTQIIMLVDNAFAAAHVGIPFSSDFPGTRHSTTIANLAAAVAGDATQLAWFTDTFLPGPAAGAVFDSFGPFTVAEFTSLTIDGVSIAFGNWIINSKQTIGVNTPGTINDRATEIIDETAQVDTGPFDIAFDLITHSQVGQLAIDKTVHNNTGVDWQSFEMLLMPATTSYFVTDLTNTETTGAFPNVTVVGNHIVFTGLLPAGGTAHFIVFVGTTVNDEPTVTLRQIANTRVNAPAPLLGHWSLASLALLLFGLAALRLRMPKAARRTVA